MIVRAQRTKVVIAVLLLGGCSITHDARQLPEHQARPEPSDDDDPRLAQAPHADAGEQDEHEMITEPYCGDKASKTLLVLSKYCATCHGEPPGDGDLANITELYGLIADGQVVPDDAQDSPLYRSIADSTMPPAGYPAPSAEEKQAVFDWISCGAPAMGPDVGPRFVDINDRLGEMLDAVRAIAAPDERRDVRFLDLSPLGNEGMRETDLQEHRDALALIMNTAFEASAAVPVEFSDSRSLVVRVRLSALGWTPDDWQALVTDYPYAVRYDEDSELFPYDEQTAEALRSETGTAIPFVHADWFIAHTLAPVAADEPWLSNALVQKVLERYAADLSVSEVAAVLGLVPEQLEQVLAVVRGSELPIVTELREPDARITRSELEASFADLVGVIGLGEQVVIE
jgi:hypothetical protein